MKSDWSRRGFLMSGLAVAGIAASGRAWAQAWTPSWAAQWGSPSSTLAYLAPATVALILKEFPFKLGVASGDPWPDSVVLWTKLVADPLDTEARTLGDKPLPVEWFVFEDKDASILVNRGVALSSPEFHHAVHLEVGGLRPGREYWYVFRYGDFITTPARTKTAPAADAAVDRLRFAFCSCSEFEEAGYHAYAHMADPKHNLDFIAHLGDYIYETTFDTKEGEPKRTRQLISRRKCITLDDYRRRYAEYRSDPALRNAHAAAPWIVTWDDHEVENDYAGLWSETNWDRSPAKVREFTQLRRAAYHAYYEHMPLRASSQPGKDGRLALYRRLDYGTLLRLHVLDTRQFRSQQACRRQRVEHQLAKNDGVWRGGNFRPDLCEEYADPDRTVLGAAQENWLRKGLDSSKAKWNVIAQSVMVTGLDARHHKAVDAPYQKFVHSDTWVGYPRALETFTGLLADTPASNPLVLSGDIHAFFTNQLHAGNAAAQSPAGVEFVVGAISSWIARNEGLRPIAQSPCNAHTIRYANLGQWHGYAIAELTADEAGVSYLGWPHKPGVLLDPKTPPVELAKFQVRPGTRRLETPVITGETKDGVTAALDGPCKGPLKAAGGKG